MSKDEMGDRMKEYERLTEHQPMPRLPTLARVDGRELQVVDRWFPSSKTCSGCGHVVEKMPLNIREWECAKCGAVHDRDVNAAINIKSAGTVDYTCGGARRPKRAKHDDACPVETGIPQH